jgi:hypothetical protein
VRFREGGRLHIQTFFLRTICTGVLLGILVAGLWPFHAPRNEVSWLSGENGLLFGKHGSIVSASPIQAGGSQADKSCSLEIWLEPNRINSEGTVLAVYWPSRDVVSFSLRQWRNGLVLERESRGHSAWEASIYVANVFRDPKPLLFAISSGPAGTAIYADGKLVRKYPDFKLISQDLSGQVILGNGPLTAYNWSGQVKGLAVYDREIAATEVSQNYANWTAGWPARESESESGRTDTAKSEGVVARYLFNEGKGNVVHNQIDSAASLVIPERFFILHQLFLEPPWDEFRPGWHYWKNVGINVAGFIPLGFFFLAYFSTTGRFKRAIGLTIALGFAVSLTIEVLQAFLPTRDSGMTDLITNTFGTALGAMAWVWIVGKTRGSISSAGDPGQLTTSRPA